MQSMTKLILKNQGTSNGNRRKKTNTQAGNPQTQAQGETPQHNRLAFPPIQETRLQVSGHSRRAILPMSLSPHLDAKESAVHCELHYLKFVKQEPPSWLTKVKAHPGPWPSIPVPSLPSKCSEHAASGSRKQLQ